MIFIEDPCMRNEKFHIIASKCGRLYHKRFVLRLSYHMKIVGILPFFKVFRVN